MKIYIDFDDVICETAKYFTKIAKELFDIEVPYREVQFFNLQKSFDLSEEQYNELMKAGHVPENLLAYEEAPGASEVINKWVDEGHEVFVVTGRPFDSYEPSRRWLDEHHLDRIPIYFVDKYGREMFKQDHTYNLTLEELYRMHFDFAIEDSPAAFEHVQHFKDCKVAVYDRPWNRQVEFPDDRFVRCLDWTEIDHVFEQALFVLKEMRNQCAHLELITRFKLKSRRTVLNRFNDIREMSGLARGDLSYLDVLKILNTFVQISDIKRQIFFFYLNMSFKGRKKIADKALSKMGRKKLSVWMKL